MKVTAFKISINNNKFDVINSTNITFNLFVYGINFEDKHFSIDDKISKIDLFYSMKILVRFLNIMLIVMFIKKKSRNLQQFYFLCR